LKTVEAERENVLVLTWSVDYWDYLGEEDPMAMPESKARQADYVQNFGLRGPYTPQSVYNGAMHCPGNRPKDVNRMLDRAGGETDAALVKVARAPHGQVTLSAAPGFAGTARVQLVEYLPFGAHETEMVNPVTSARELGIFTGGVESFDAPDCAHKCVIVAQDIESLQVVGMSELG